VQRGEGQEAGEWWGVLLAPPMAPHICLWSARCPGGTNGTGTAGLALTVTGGGGGEINGERPSRQCEELMC